MRMRFTLMLLTAMGLPGLGAAQTSGVDLAGKTATVRALDPSGQAVGPTVKMHMFPNGALRREMPGNQGWATWRMSPGGALCTREAMETGEGIKPVGDEECVAVTLEGNAIQFVFVGTTGHSQAFEGTLAPIQ